jgi:nicotinate-nucleotide--dimethylbenzimidazole phosphoribosyltransferase
MSEIIRHVVDSIGPASRAHGEAVRAKVAAANVEVLAALAQRLGAAQHTTTPRLANRTVVVVASDREDPGISLGPSHPTAIAATAIADGSAALCTMARASRAPIVLVDAGAKEPLPAMAISLEPTLEAGIALAISLSEPGLDLLAIGAIGLAPDPTLLAGLILGAASLHVPVILDGQITGAAAVVAADLAPDVTGYLIASHAGSPDHAALLTQLGLQPLFAVGLGHGEGIGAAMVFPWIDQVAALVGVG